MSDKYDRRLNNIQQKHITQVMEKEKVQEIKKEIVSLENEREKINSQIRELRTQLKNDKENRYRFNMNLGFIPKSDILK